MDPEIEFEWEGKRYTVPHEAYEQNIIELPDGRLLEADSWLESMPPQPRGLHLLHGVRAELKEEVPAT